MNAFDPSIFHPRHLLKRHTREIWPVEGETGAMAILRSFRLPEYFGEATEAIAFRDQDSWVRCICAYFPQVAHVVDLRINRHISSIAFTRIAPGFNPSPMDMADMSSSAASYRGRGL